MLQSQLQPPKTGRSRFSKALPSVPGLNHDASPTATALVPPPRAPRLNTTTLVAPAPTSLSSTPTPTSAASVATTSAFPLPPKVLPQLPSLSSAQNDAPKLSASPLYSRPSNDKPSSSPAQSQSPLSALPASASGTPRMAIPRRPVGKSSISTPSPATSTPLTATPVTATELPAQYYPLSAVGRLPSSHMPPEVPSKGPVYEMDSVPRSPSAYSLSSLLSAYSRSSDDLVLQSPEDITAANSAVVIHDFDAAASPDVRQTSAKYEFAEHVPASAPAPAPAPVSAATSTPPPPPAPAKTTAPPTTDSPSALASKRNNSLDKPLPAPMTANISTFSLFPQKAKTPVGLPKSPAPQQHQPVTRKVVLDRSLPPPPPPLKSNDDEPTPPPKDEPRVPTSPVRKHLPSSSEFSIAAPSPPRPQIWRRRSNSRELPDLKLNFSHGSTAEVFFTAPSNDAVQAAQSKPSINTTSAGDASAARAAPQAPAQPASIASKPLPVPQPLASQGIGPSPSSSIGLPGRNIRPSRSKPSTDDTQTMGHGSSKLQQLKDKFHSSKMSDGFKIAKKDSTASRPADNRPPTPEYQKQDVKTPVLDTFVSPVSPASSPEPHNQLSPDISKNLPQPPSHAQPQPPASDAKPITRKAIGLSPASSGPSLNSAKSLPDLKASPPLRSSEPPLPAPSTAASSRRQSPNIGPPSGQHRRGDSARPSTREGHARPDGRSGQQGRHSAPESDPRIVRSNSRGSMYRGRDGTLYPNMKDLRSPDPRAFNFPINNAEVVPPGTVFHSLPLKESHFNCFQKHKNMKRMVNRNYPLTCQTCDREDAEDRFTCNFCHLRVCESCIRAFDEYKRDLRKFVDTMGAVNGKAEETRLPVTGLGLTFTPPPTSALALEA